MMIMINALYVATENLGIYHVVEKGWGHALVSCRLVGIPACIARVWCRRDLLDSLGRLQHQKRISRNSNSSRLHLQIRVKIDDLEPAYYHYLSTIFFANYLLVVNADTGPRLRFFRLLFPFPHHTLMSVYRSRGFVHGVNLRWRGWKQLQLTSFHRLTIAADRPIDLMWLLTSISRGDQTIDLFYVIFNAVVPFEIYKIAKTTCTIVINYSGVRRCIKSLVAKLWMAAQNYRVV